MAYDDAPHAVVLFDGVCNLCNGFVQFVIPRDPEGYFQFAALSSDAARRLMRQAGVASGGADSIVLIDPAGGRRAYVRSAAALRIARRLRFPWPLLYSLVLVPPQLRDPVYDLVARNRLRWFGQRETCLVPDAPTKDRFLD